METQVLQALSRGYCSPENEHKVLDPVLINAMAKEIIKCFSPSEREADRVDDMIDERRDKK